MAGELCTVQGAAHSWRERGGRYSARDAIGRLAGVSRHNIPAYALHQIVAVWRYGDDGKW